MADGKFLSIGFGTVGQAVPERAVGLGLEHSEFVIKSKGTFTHDTTRDDQGRLILREYDSNPDFWKDPAILKDVKIAFLAIDSSQGDRSFEIIKALLAKDIPVVTAEKGALANYFGELVTDLGRIGTGATVGGGTRMLPALLEHVGPRTTQIDGIVNGTLNYVMDGLAHARTLGQMVEEGRNLGYAEPRKASDPEPPTELEGYLDTLNGELGDTRLKTTIVCNMLLSHHLGEVGVITPDVFEETALSLDDLSRLKAEAETRRHIITIARASFESTENDMIAGFRTELGGWVVKGGFRNIGMNPIYKENLVLPGPFNGAIVQGGPGESDGLYAVAVGPGAGPGPTSSSMVLDARQLLRRAA